MSSEGSGGGGFLVVVGGAILTALIFAGWESLKAIIGYIAVALFILLLALIKGK